MMRAVPTDGSMRRLLAVSLLVLALAGCHGRTERSQPVGLLATAASSTPPPMAITLAPQINQADFLRYDKTLASSALGGRKPDTRGEVLTTHFLIAQLKTMGIAPGYRGTWLQPVPVVSTRLLNTGTRLIVQLPDGVQRFAYGTDMLAATQQARAHVSIAGAPMVFVGYGIDAPTRQWNDYQDLDVRGKIVIVLANDPGEAASPDSPLSRYGLARYKFEQAARRGAAGCFIIHARLASDHTWNALRNASAGAAQSLPAHAAAGPQLAVAGWLRHAAAERLFSAAGLNLDALSRQAAEAQFKAVTLPGSASIRLESAVAYGWTDNVLGWIRGTTHPRQVVIYSAHWDGLGTIRGAHGRPQLLPGAIDNASGVAALLEIADSLAHRKSRPLRSILFLLPTLGQAGQLGSRYYVQHPVFPLDQTVADIDINLWPVLGRARDMSVYGTAQSGLAAELAQLLALQGRTLTRDPAPATGLFYRSDQYSFTRAGVPSLLTTPGFDLVSGGREAGEAQWRRYLMERLDTPLDAFDPQWDLSGTLEDIQTLYLLGRDLADGTQWPNWAPDSPYRARRDAMMKNVPGALMTVESASAP
jgi:Zn-dependent M28 family amino/carboxypeptidase